MTQPSAESPAIPENEPPDGPAVSSDIASGTRPPRVDVSPGYPEPSGDFIELYNVHLARPLINNVRGVTVGGHFSNSFGVGGVVTRIWFDVATGVTYIRANENKNPESPYRRTWMLLPDGSVADIDPQKGREIRGE